jgi:hypothetical protein
MQMTGIQNRPPEVRSGKLAQSQQLASAMVGAQGDGPQRGSRTLGGEWAIRQGWQRLLTEPDFRKLPKTSDFGKSQMTARSGRRGEPKDSLADYTN